MDDIGEEIEAGSNDGIHKDRKIRSRGSADSFSSRRNETTANLHRESRHANILRRGPFPALTDHKRVCYRLSLLVYYSPTLTNFQAKGSSPTAEAPPKKRHRSNQDQNERLEGSSITVDPPGFANAEIRAFLQVNIYSNPPPKLTNKN